MPTIGDVIRPLFPGFDLTDAGAIFVARPKYVSEPGVRDALRSTPLRDLALADTDVLIAMSTQVPLTDPAELFLLDDRFDGNALSAQWAATAGNPTVAGSKLHLPVSASVTANLTLRPEGRKFTVEGCAEPGTVGLGIRIRSTVSTARFLQFSRSGASLLAYVSPTPAGETYTVAVPYNVTAHAYRRIREAGGTVYFETSADGATWTAMRTTPTPTWLPLEAALFAVITGTGTGEATIDRATIV